VGKIGGFVEGENWEGKENFDREN
jgi:hypothetical protein